MCRLLCFILKCIKSFRIFFMSGLVIIINYKNSLELPLKPKFLCNFLSFKASHKSPLHAFTHIHNFYLQLFCGFRFHWLDSRGAFF